MIRFFKNNSEYAVALKVVWLILTLITVTVLLMPVILDKQAVLEITPTCVSISRFGTECAVCGMSRSFLEITDGNLKEAIDINNGSVYVYSLFLLNSISFIAYITFFYLNNKN